jgi:hypothetical protein
MSDRERIAQLEARVMELEDRHVAALRALANKRATNWEKVNAAGLILMANDPALILMDDAP